MFRYARCCLKIAVAILAFPAGCADAANDGGDGSSGVASATDRRFANIQWDTLFSIGGSPEDTLLLRPRLIRARDGLLYAYDYYDARVKAFDSSGRLRWSFGRQGKGPGEFGNATDIQIGPDGDVWIVDSVGARITRISASGELGRMVPFDGSMFLRVVPLAEKTLVIPIDTAAFWLALDDSGRVAGRGPLPLPELQAAHPAVRTPFVATAPSGDAWAAVFAWGSPLAVYEGTVLRCTGALIEGGSFPQAPSPGNTVWAIGVGMSDDAVFVLARGETGGERRMIDEYSADDCRYRRTLRLHGVSQAIAYDSGIFYLYREEPAPTILALRPRRP